MRLNLKTLRSIFLLTAVFFSMAVVSFANPTDDDLPEIRARVARVSYIKGEAQIRRAGNDDWEKITKNLPIVEGDEIATSKYTLLEIQFDIHKYLRLTDDTLLNITTLRDSGIVLSVPQGSVSMRVFEFDKDREFIEFDAPKTTIAVQKAGFYRVDAGDENYKQVHVRVTEDGEARVYSDDAGFVLRDGRSARIFTTGSYAGEWDLSDARLNMDQFDTWTSERDEVIAERLRKADYDKYYDRDFYGAEDLSDNGEWIYTSDYGYVWRPYRRAISGYDDWSPYRYGQWRWVPPYGWTWINDEPWGWAAYHHGRWVYYNGDWCWTPYSRSRSSRSWWRPALVVVASIGNNICWYPLGYDYNYYNYNYYYYGGNYGNRRRGRGGDRHPRDNNGENPTPTPTPTRNIQRRENTGFPDGIRRPPADSVIFVGQSDFGRGKTRFRTAPPDLARKTLLKTTDQIEDIPLLPTFSELDGDISRDIIVRNPAISTVERRTQIGAADKRTGGSVDEKLREKRIYGSREPSLKVGGNDDSVETNRRRTGVFNRVRREQTDQSDPLPDANQIPERNTRRNNSPVRTVRGNNPPAPQPERREVETEKSPEIRSSPVRENIRIPNERRESPRNDPPPRREPPRNDPSPRNDPPPPREQPRNDPSPRNDPPPQKSEPKQNPSDIPQFKGKPDGDNL